MDAPAPLHVPPFFGLEVTKRCNQRCPHCFTSSGAADPIGASLDELAGVLRQVAELGLKTVALTGGETLLRDDLEELMRRGRSFGIESYSLVTNGTLVTTKRAKSLAEAGLRSAQVSLDGVDARDHREVRACHELDFYRAARGARRLRDAGIKVDVATIVAPRNVARAAEQLALAQVLGVRGVRYCTFVPTGRAAAQEIASRFAVEPERLDRFLGQLRAWRSRPRPPLRVLMDHGMGPWMDDGRFACGSGRRVVYVCANGDLYPCTGLIFAALRVGNVYATPLRELLASPAMHTARRIKRRELAEPCRSCRNARCTGGCRGLAYALTGDLRGSIPYCNVHRRLAAAGARAAADT